MEAADEVVLGFCVYKGCTARADWIGTGAICAVKRHMSYFLFPPFPFVHWFTQKAHRTNFTLLPIAGLLVFSFPFLARAGSLERIGHTTLVPRHTNPDDKGMYAAVIDPVNGYAYFIGSYLFKLDITGPLPVQVGPSLYTGQFAGGVIDVAGGYAYFPGAAIKRYALGTGAAPVSAAGSLTLTEGAPACVVIDDSDPNPAKHYLYALSWGSPATVTKVALSTFTQVNSITLAPGENKFLLGTVEDAQKGYAYFVSAPNSTSSNIPVVVKVKMTPGTNAPIRIGAVTLDTVAANIDGASIDTAHGYAYYGTYDSDPTVSSKLYKVKLEDGDVAPTLVGNISLQPGEGRLSASVVDPVNGYVYFADDNSYPGHIYQFNINGPNLPTEVAVLPLQGGTNNNPPPNGTTAANVSSDSNLPYGEVFFRSAVFDPVRGYAYFGQDSRPNQVIKVRLATLATPAQPLNISTRARVQADPGELIGGFIIAGGDPKSVLIRGMGPSLSSVGVTLSDPTLELHQGGTTVATNDNWKTKPDGTSQQAEIEATTIPPTNDLESAILATLSPGAYTAILAGKNGGTGVGLVEVYDLAQGANSKLANISTRGFVDTGDNVMIGGLIVGGGSGGGAATVIVRALGPSLTGFGVAGALDDPTLELHDGSGMTIATNDDWKTRPDGSSQQAEIEATTIPPTNDLESALVRTLPPGNYTAIVRGKNSTTGVGLVEAYNLQ